MDFYREKCPYAGDIKLAVDDFERFKQWKTTEIYKKTWISWFLVGLQKNISLVVMASVWTCCLDPDDDSIWRYFLDSSRRQQLSGCVRLTSIRILRLVSRCAMACITMCNSAAKKNPQKSLPLLEGKQKMVLGIFYIVRITFLLLPTQKIKRRNIIIQY